METRGVELDALNMLKTGFLYILVATLLAIIGIFVGLASIFAVVGAVFEHPFHYVASAAGASAVFFILLLISAAVSLYAIFGKIRPGMRLMSQIDRGFDICHTGTTLMLVGLIVVILGLITGLLVIGAGAAAAMPFSALSGVFVILGAVFIGGIVILIGGILAFIVGAFKLYGRYNNTLYIAAGILYVVDLALAFVGVGGILSLVGTILMYVALKETIEKISYKSATPS